MKNLVVVIAFLMASTVSFAQGAFDKFDGQDDVTSVIVNKKMFDMIGKVKIGRAHV